jgi:hypothetical protein
MSPQGSQPGRLLSVAGRSCLGGRHGLELLSARSARYPRPRRDQPTLSKVAVAAFAIWLRPTYCPIPALGKALSSFFFFCFSQRASSACDVLPSQRAFEMRTFECSTQLDRKVSNAVPTRSTGYSLLIFPHAPTATAFEHVDDAGRARVHHCSNQDQPLPACAANLLCVALQNSHFLTAE